MAQEFIRKNRVIAKTISYSFEEATEVHKKTIDAFKKEFIDSGLLDAKLLVIYKQMII